MGLLLSCWFIVGTILIPSGLGRWTRLSYFVHPVVLLFCELYLVSQRLLRTFLFLLLLPFKLLLWTIVFVFRWIRTTTSALISLLVRVIEVSVDSGVEHDGEEYFEAVPAEDPSRSVALANPWLSSRKRRFESDEEEEEEDQFFPASSGEDSIDYGFVFYQPGKRKRDEEIDEKSESGIPSPQLSSFIRGEPEDDDHHQIASAPFRRSTRRDRVSLLTGGEPEKEEKAAPLPPSRLTLERELPVEEEPEAERVDSSYSLKTIPRRRRGGHRAVPAAAEGEPEEPVPVPVAAPPRGAFHEEYEKRMAWFDRVNQERNGEASELLRLLLQNPSFRVEDDFRRLQGTVYRSLLRSMEISLEMVYVGQACLSWEALHRQHVRAKALCDGGGGGGGGVPWEPTVGKFKLFWEILERYLENEGVESSRRWTYSRSRLSAAKPLQVPEISGNERRRDGAPAVREVVAAVERAIDVFWDFLQCDDHRPAGRLRRLLWVEPQAEDPGDLYLLDHLKKIFRKKERLMEKLVDRRGRWWRAMSTSAAAESRWLNPQDYFAAMEMKLVGRVLGMPVISTQQLQWCEKKLARLEVRSSRVLRSSHDDGQLFPYS